MATTRAQHAAAGEYHLETFYAEGQWGWKAVAIRNKKLPEYTGVSKTLDEAKKSAMASIGLMQANSTYVWPFIEIPDYESN
jgi:hypothetical protein